MPTIYADGLFSKPSTGILHASVVDPPVREKTSGNLILVDAECGGLGLAPEKNRRKGRPESYEMTGSPARLTRTLSAGEPDRGGRGP